MKKLLSVPAVAVILSLLLMFASSVLSTHLKISDRLLDAQSEGAAAYFAEVEDIIDLSEKFPGRVLIRCAGIDVG